MSLSPRAIYGNPSTANVNVPGINVGDYVIDPTGAVPGVAFVVLSGGVKARMYFPAVPTSLPPQDGIAVESSSSGSGNRRLTFTVTNGGVPAAGVRVLLVWRGSGGSFAGAIALGMGPVLDSATSGHFIGVADNNGQVAVDFDGDPGVSINWIVATVSANPDSDLGVAVLPA